MQWAYISSIVNGQRDARQRDSSVSKERDVADEFNKLQQQYFDATIDERNRLWPNFIRAIRQTYPGFLEEVEHKFRNGDYLMAMFGQCMKRVLARPDLNAGRKTNAQEDAAVFMAAFDELKQADSQSRELTFELAIRALFTGLRVGLNPEEVENFIKETHTELTQRATVARRQKNDVGITARHAAIRAICAEKGWRLDERGIAEALAAVIKSDPRYKDENGKPLFSASRRTIADDLTSLATTSSSPDKR
jgi:hypothetical protein